MVQMRTLTSGETEPARTVYASAIPFGRVFITDLELGSAVTFAGINAASGKFDYTIDWQDGSACIMTDAERRATLMRAI